MSVHGHSCRLHLGPAADSTPRRCCIGTGTGPGPPTAAAATAAGTPGAGHPPTATPVGCRPRRPLPGKWQWNLLVPQQILAQISQMHFSLPLAGKRCALPMKQLLHQEETAEITTTTAMSFSHGFGLFFLQIVIPLRFRSHFEHVLPCSSSAAPIGTKLIGANGTNIPTWGFQNHTLDFGDKTFTHDFLLTKVATPHFRLGLLHEISWFEHHIDTGSYQQDQQQHGGGAPGRRASRQQPHHQPQQVHLHGARAGGVRQHHQLIRHHPHPPAYTGNHRVPTSNVKNERTNVPNFRYHFGNETKMFWYRSQICHVENRLFRFGPESALLDQIEMCSLYWNVCGTYVDRWLPFAPLLFWHYYSSTHLLRMQSSCTWGWSTSTAV